VKRDGDQGYILMHDPTPWLMEQEGISAVRARRSLGLFGHGDDQRVCEVERELATSQHPDGGFECSPLKTAGVLNLLADIQAEDSKGVTDRAVAYLVAVLKSQPGYERAKRVKPGCLKAPCDLCGFFGPYEDRNAPRLMAEGTEEMNMYREYEPLFGPKTPVRGVRRSTLDRAGPPSCYSWGLIPLAYIVEAICRAGHATEPRLVSAVNVLLGAQRASGGWCRNLGGHPSCTLHALRAIGAHPRLQRSAHAERALEFMQRQLAQRESRRRTCLFPALQAVARFQTPAAHGLIRELLATAAERQCKNGTFGKPCQVERVAVVLKAMQSLKTTVRQE
jgi:hypothetical protein